MKKRCRRKVWSTEINPIAHAIAGASITDKASLDKLRLAELSALEAMTKGNGTVEDWRMLVDLMNISEMFGKNGIGPEILPFCKTAQDSLHKAALRYESTNKMGLDGAGIQALREVHEYHDLQRTSVARSVYERMIQKTRDNIKSHGKDVVVIEPKKEQMPKPKKLPLELPSLDFMN